MIICFKPSKTLCLQLHISNISVMRLWQMGTMLLSELSHKLNITLKRNCTLLKALEKNLGINANLSGYLPWEDIPCWVDPTRARQQNPPHLVHLLLHRGAAHVASNANLKTVNVLPGCRGSIHTWHCCVYSWREITVHDWNCQNHTPPWGALDLVIPTEHSNSTRCICHRSLCFLLDCSILKDLHGRPLIHYRYFQYMGF